MLKVAVGHSNDPDSESAIDIVVEQCRSSLEGVAPKAGILFASSDFDLEVLLQRIHQTWDNLELIGCSTNGEISSVMAFQQDSAMLVLFCGDTVEIAAGVGRNVSKDPVAATREAIDKARSKLNSRDPKLCLVTPESLTTSGVSIIDGLSRELGENFPIFGGAAGNASNQAQTFQFFNTEVLSDAVPVLLFAGNIHFSHGIACGWNPLGNQSRVTRSQKNRVETIDDRPAIDFYEYYLGTRTHSVEYPIAIFEADGNFYLRAPQSWDEEDGSITFFADVPENATIQITEASRDNILAAAEESLDRALESYPGEQPEAALFFTCAFRKYILGTRTKEEYELVRDRFTQSLPSGGFYTNGEISPIAPGTPTRFHNETFVTLLLGSQ